MSKKITKRETLQSIDTGIDTIKCDKRKHNKYKEDKTSCPLKYRERAKSEPSKDE